MAAGKYQIVGVESSPYSIKLRAVMRYRHLPFVWLCRMPQYYPPLLDVRPLLMPVVCFPDGSRHIDSTPIIFALEDRHPGQRTVQPPNPVLAFYSMLIEDMADEWLTKILFFYRFAHPTDRSFAATWVMDDAFPDIEQAELNDKAEEFLARQIERMASVGALPENAPVIQASFLRILNILEPFCALDRFLFGSRPALADFGLFGQLRTLSTDPTPAAIFRAQAPRTENWVRRLDDLSGVSGAWQTSGEANATVLALLTLAGDTYLPFLQANADALANGREIFTVSLPAGPYQQAPFGYQVKCLAALRQAYASLEPADRERAQATLKQTGCLDYF
ncbi:MAG: glutathione S-transferase C-terminal domain-containing protein [Alphaproteobacteria bacterium]|jgi:glutathione S-transferase